MANLRPRKTSTAFIVLNFILMILPVVAVFCIRKEIDVYAFRTILTEKTYVFILAMTVISAMSFYKFKEQRFSFSARIILVVETMVGICLYMILYDYILTY